MATTKSKSPAPKAKSPAKAKSSTSTTKRTSRRTSTKPTASKTSPSPKTSPKTSPKSSSPAAEGSAKISLSEPLAQGTQIIATVSGLTPGEAVKVRIDGPAARHERSRLRADPSGQTQVFIHGPQPGAHTISLEADSGTSSIEFEVK